MSNYHDGRRNMASNKVYIWQRSTIDTHTGCINWTGPIFPNGYGSATRGRGPRLMAHRLAYETFVGQIADGLVIDHLCSNRRCVNVDHLEPVTQGTNAARGGGLVKAMKKYRARTHCVHGHAYTPENTFVSPATGRRACKQCQREASLRYYHERKAGA